jgi:hypothetical protein
MGFTDQKWEQGTPQTDLHLAIGTDEFVDFAAVSTLPAAPAAGLLYKVVPTTAAAKFFHTPEAPMYRSGVYGTDQEQFGTAGGTSGPSTVANTSGPLALAPGIPPITAANLATVGGTIGGSGILHGPIPKGIQINSIDVIYQVLAVNASAATIGLTRTFFQNGVAPVVTNIIALGTNGLVLTIGAQVQVINVPVTSPAMIVPAQNGDTIIILNVNFTAGAGGTVNFYGCVLNCSYNLN